MPTIIMMFKCERNHNNFKGLESKDDMTQLTEPKDGSRDDRLSWKWMQIREACQCLYQNRESVSLLPLKVLLA